MTGVDIVGALLCDSEVITAVVPAARIKAGALPDNIILPALLVRLVSSVESKPLKRGEVIRNTDRVSVTVRANDYLEQTAIILLVKNTCAGRVGEFAGAARASVLTAGTGPDVSGPASSFEQTQDLRVSFDAQT